MQNRIAFCLFIFCLLLEMEWFGNTKQLKETNHQKAFRRILIALMAAAVAKLIKYVGIHYFDNQIEAGWRNIGFCLFYSALTFVAVYYCEFCYSIVKLDSVITMKKRILMQIPCYVVTIFLFLDPVFHHVLDISGQGEYLYAKPVMYIQVIVVICYCLPGFITIFRNSHYLPKTLIQSQIILIILWLSGNGIMFLSKSDDIVLPAFAIGTTLLMFAILSYGKFYDDEVKLFNKKALYTYLDNCVEKRMKCTLFLVRILGYQYFVEAEEGNRTKRIILKLKERLETELQINNIYYVEKGRIVLVLNRREKIDERNMKETLLQVCEDEFQIDGMKIALNTDIFILQMPRDIKSVEQLKLFLRYNENAVQVRDMEEKVHIYEDDALDVKKAIRVKQIEEAVRRAIEQKSFQVYFQPIYSNAHQEIHSAEALIRLTDPELGFIPPDEFIPVAEKNGSILEVGLQVFEKVCQFWHNEKPEQYGLKYIEVNMSMEQFMDDLLYYKLLSVMDKYEVPKNALNLEITETATMYEESKLRRQMKFMSEKGFAFSLDDYGSGYSNMEAVVEYPLTLVKLDKSIVTSAVSNVKSYSTMQSLIDLFHNLGMEIVAEGVETEEQIEILKQMNCDYIQGYYYSKPLPKEVFLEYLLRFRQELK